MEKVVSILSLLKKDEKLVERLEDVQENVTRYREELESKLKYIQRDLKRCLDDVEWYNSRITENKKDIQRIECDIKNKATTFDDGKVIALSTYGSERLKKIIEKWQTYVDEYTLKLAECTEKISKLQDSQTILQDKLKMSNDELILLEVNELTKQLIEVRAEISKQLNLKV